MGTCVSIRTKDIRGPALCYPPQKICWMSPHRRQGLFFALPGGQFKTVINNNPQDSLSNNPADERLSTL